MLASFNASRPITGEENEVEDYDWTAITKAVKSFVDDYNSVVGQAGDSDTKNVLALPLLLRKFFKFFSINYLLQFWKFF